MKIKVGIIGASGYTAQELTAILAEDTYAEIVFLKSSEAKTSEFTGQAFEDLSYAQMIERNPDIVFFATPHGVAMNECEQFLEAGIKVIDLSGDFRFKDIQTFEQAYNMPHTNPERKGVFGLPELFAEDIKKASLIANPGCYVTSALLAGLPLLGKATEVVFDAKSGYSGAGKKYNKLKELKNNTILPYNLTKHRHWQEIQQFIDFPIYFTPHVLARFRGIENTAHFFIKKEYRDLDFVALFTEYYKNFPLIKIQKEIPNVADVCTTNGAILGGFEIDERGRLIIISCLDNIRKGAASQAVENMHLSFNLPYPIPEPKKFLKSPYENEQGEIDIDKIDK